jgi:formamidopyrimidine-DNA glycosylase
MPELPEVETIAAGLRRKIVGLRIADIRIFLPKLDRGRGAIDVRKFSGRKILDVRRRGKMILVTCENGLCLLFHLKMTGQFLWTRMDAERDAHTHLAISFAGRNRELRFRDVRKFGFVRCLETPCPAEAAELRSLGFEPLETSLDTLTPAILARKGRLKSLLLNQTFIAGIGNIYADEILFESRLHPLTPAAFLSRKEAARLWSAMQSILRRAVAAGGSSIRDYKDADGLDGHFQFQLKAYGRKGSPCSRCGRTIRRDVIGGRASFFCSRCQRRKGRHRRRTPERNSGF